MTVTVTVLAVVCAVFAIIFMAIRVTKAPIYGLLSKTLASMAFVAMGAVGVLLGAKDGMDMEFGGQLIVLGLAYGMVGDIVLDLKRAHSEFEGKYLVSGMLSFAMGHAAYVAAIVLVADGKGIDVLLPALVSAGAAILLSPVIMFVSKKFMKAVYGKFLGISAAYAALLVFVTLFTVWLTILDSSFLLVALGMIAFLLSDLVLSTMYFVEGKKEDKLLVIVNHTLYYAAQILIACWLFSLIG